MPIAKLLRLSEIALALNVSENTIYYWVSRYEIPFLRIGRHLRFKHDEVLQFFINRTKDRAPCRGTHRLIEPTQAVGRTFSPDSPGSLKIRDGKFADT